MFINTYYKIHFFTLAKLVLVEPRALFIAVTSYVFSLYMESALNLHQFASISKTLHYVCDDEFILLIKQVKNTMFHLKTVQ